MRKKNAKIVAENLKTVFFRKFPAQPCFSQPELPFSRRHIQSQDLGGFLHRHPSEKLELQQLCLDEVDLLQTRQGDIDAENIFKRYRSGRHQVVQCYRLSAGPAL